MEFQNVLHQTGVYLDQKQRKKRRKNWMKKIVVKKHGEKETLTMLLRLKKKNNEKNLLKMDLGPAFRLLVYIFHFSSYPISGLLISAFSYYSFGFLGHCSISLDSFFMLIVDNLLFLWYFVFFKWLTATTTTTKMHEKKTKPN